VKVYPAGGGSKTALAGVSLTLAEGSCLGVVGESGCGKTTLSRAVLNLIPASGGAVTVLGRDLTRADQESLRAARKDLQIVLQDPLASLDPRSTVGDSVAEPLQVLRVEVGDPEEALVAHLHLVVVGSPIQPRMPGVEGLQECRIIRVEDEEPKRVVHS